MRFFCLHFSHRLIETTVLRSLLPGNSQWIVTGSDDRIVHVSDAESGICLWALHRHTDFQDQFPTNEPRLRWKASWQWIMLVNFKHGRELLNGKNLNACRGQFFQINRYILSITKNAKRQINVEMDGWIQRGCNEVHEV